MGYRKKYHGLRITRYDQTPSGKVLKNKYAIIDSSNLLVSAVGGLTKAEAKRLLPYYQKQKKFVFTG